MADWRKYGVALLGLFITVGFGATFFLYSPSNPGGGTNTNDQQDTRNFTLPSQNFKVGSFDKSMTEQVVISANDGVAFVNLYYDNESQKEEFKKMKAIQDNFGDKVYIQIVNSTTTSEVLSRNGITEFPTAVVVTGVRARRGYAPSQSVISKDITQKEIEKAICANLNDLEGAVAYCRSIGAF